MRNNHANERAQDAEEIGSSPLQVMTLPTFEAWVNELRDRQAQQRIILRLNRVKTGNFGDAKPVGTGVFEMRIDYGPGYRVYFGREGATLVVVLAGGDKSTQQKDIDRAKELWREYRK